MNKETLGEKINNYAIEHPVIIMIIIAIVLGIVVSFIVESLKKLFFEKETPTGVIINRVPKVVFRLITLVISAGVSFLVLLILGSFIQTLELRILFMLSMTFVPFMFYHLKGAWIVSTVINKLSKKAEGTKI